MNTLVFGEYGIGKTIFLLESLCELATDKKFFPIYTTLEGNTSSDFDVSVLFALSEAMYSWSERAKEIHDVLTGRSTSKETGREVGMDVGTGSLMPISITLGGQGTESQTIQRNAVSQPRHEFIMLLEECQKRYSRIIIAVDEVDKQDPEKFYTLLSGSRATLDVECSFIVTGGLWAPWLTQNPNRSIYGAFGEEIKLNPFNLSTTRDVIIAYLNSAREKENNHTWPFTEDAIEYTFTRSKGVPRQFNHICYEAINGVIDMELDVEEIDKTIVEKCLKESGRGRYSNLQENEQFIVDTIRCYGGILSNENTEALTSLGIFTVFDLAPVLDKLVQQDILVKREGTRTIQYEIAPSLAVAVDAQSAI